MDADDVIAYVGEECEDDSRFRASFKVAVERYGQRWWQPAREKLDGADLRTAVAWARERAPIVLVTIGGEDALFSAGEHNPEPESFPQLPAAAFELKPRRRGASWDGSMPPGVEGPGPLRRFVTRWWFTATAVALLLLVREAFDLYGFWEGWALAGGFIAALVVGLVVWGRFTSRKDQRA